MSSLQARCLLQSRAAHERSVLHPTLSSRTVTALARRPSNSPAPFAGFTRASIWQEHQSRGSRKASLCDLNDRQNVRQPLARLGGSGLRTSSPFLKAGLTTTTTALHPSDLHPPFPLPSSWDKRSRERGSIWGAALRNWLSLEFLMRS